MKKKTSYQEKLDAANTAMNNIQLDEGLIRNVHDYLHKTEDTRDK